MRPGSPWPLLILLLPGCRTPTSVELRLSTDVSCADQPTTSITVSRAQDDSVQPATVTSSCQPDGTIGSLVILPADAKDERLVIKVVTSLGGAESTCVAPAYGPTCIVSRRQLAFIPHEELVLPVQQAIDCAGVVCGQSQTCRKGSCVSAQVDLDRCKDSPDQCGQELGPDTGAGGQGGSSGSSGQSGQAGAAEGGQGGIAGQGGVAGLGGAGGGGIGGESGGGGAGAGGAAGQGGAGIAGMSGSSGQGGAASAGGAGMSGGSGQSGAGQAGAGGAGAGGAGAGGAGAGGAGAGGAYVGLKATGVSTGNNHSCALLESGKVKCWGWNYAGQLGIGDKDSRGNAPNEMGDALPFVDLGAGLTVSKIASGSTHSCALFNQGKVKCWGNNDSGQLGLGDKDNRGDAAGEMGDDLPFVDLGTGLQAIGLALGNAFSCANFDNGRVKCWGGNTYGQLGLGTIASRGGGPDEMGDNLPFIDLGQDGDISSLAAGFGHVCARLITGKVKCWGLNNQGQLGLGDTNNRGDQGGEMGSALPIVDLGTGSMTGLLRMGSNHGCAFLALGKIKCWGNNASGSLGLGDTNNRGDGANEMGDALPFIDLGQNAAVSDIAVGYEHICARLPAGKIKCWGQSSSGQLGLGDMVKRGDNADEMGDALPFVDLGSEALVIASSRDHTCAQLLGGGVKCWGFNSEGQLGLGTTTPRGDAPGEMGDALPYVDLGTTP